MIPCRIICFTITLRYINLCARGNKVVKNSSVNLAYTIYDHGGKSATVAPAIIILHALFSNRISWDPVADSLSKITKRKVSVFYYRNECKNGIIIISIAYRQQ